MPRRLLRACRDILGWSSSLLARLAASRSAADEVDTWLATIAQAGPQGAGSAAARAASESLARQDAGILPRLLRAMETDNPVAANWGRSAYEAIVRARSDRPPRRIFPSRSLRAFVVRRRPSGSRAPAGAGACAIGSSPGYSKRVVPDMLADPEFRDDAVDMALAAGQQALEAGDSETAREQFHQAFEHARDSGQALRAAGKLTGWASRSISPGTWVWWSIGG